MEKSIRFSEFSLTLLFLLLLLSLFSLSWLRQAREPTPFVAPPQEKILIHIAGAVKKPGTYSITSGITLASALKKGLPTRFANLRSLDFEQRIEEPLTLHILELEDLKIRILGAVTLEGDYTLPLNTRICHLKKLIPYQKDADPQFFKKRRLLKDGETLHIPFKSKPEELPGTATL